MTTDTPTTTLARRPITGLIALNGILLAVLAAVSFGPGAPDASAEQARSRPRGYYTMVSAKAQGIPESAIIVVDSTNQQLVATRWDRSRRTLSGLGFRDLTADAARAPRGGR